MELRGFSVGEMLRFGWRKMKDNLLFFIGILITMWVVSGLGNFLARIFNLPVDNPLMIIIGIILSLWMTVGMIKISLAFARNEKPTFTQLFSAYPYILNYFVASILFLLLMIAGFLLLIFPMFIWGAKFGLYPYFIVEKGAGPIESLKLSAKATMGAKWDVFGLWCVCTVVIILGILALLVGLFAAIPTVYVAFAYAYRHLVAQSGYDYSIE